MNKLHLSCTVLLLAGAAAGENIRPIRVWNDKDLARWATPVAGLGVRPGHYTEHDYYAAPAGEWLRTYPVYFPGREPAGYLEALRKKGPEPLIRPGARTKKKWIRDGQIVFREMDVLPLRSYDRDLMEIVRSADALTRAGGRPQPDGTVAGLRWVPTSKGLALSVEECGGCHTRVMPDGSRIDGAPLNGTGNAVLGQLVSRAVKRLYGDAPAVWNWRSSAVPWIDGDIHESIRSMRPEDLRPVFRRVLPGTFARFNGSPYYPTKVPDLIGIADRKYIDHTATHRLRNAGDLMRYAALVGCCDSADFGPHRMFTDKQRRIHFHFPDEVLFALAEYIYSLEPPPNPNAGDSRIAAGKAIFAKDGCTGCHAPPLYTNNKLTLAEGFRPSKNHPLAADILHVSVGTDPGLALKTRKGTGFYKVPSLKGLWYRGRYGHDGAAASLEEWFDPARLAKTQGHEFGLKLSPEDKAALIAFLRSL
jgi:mono/diheme cytochrome c family protein